MKPRITVLTLGVSDLERSLTFYHDGLGLATDGIVGTEFENGAVAFFKLEGGLMLAIWPLSSLTSDSHVEASTSTGARFSIGHNVRSKAEVDEVMEQARLAGATMTSPAHDQPWGGYSGYFRDPDGHLWEVVWNPDLLPDS
jgi:catechol 2,3-dioxygenase-like lactoylglutathione lyase family enzyme